MDRSIVPLALLLVAGPASAFCTFEHREAGGRGFAAALEAYQQLHGRSPLVDEQGHPLAGLQQRSPEEREPTDLALLQSTDTDQKGPADPGSEAVDTKIFAGLEANRPVGHFTFGQLVGIYADYRKSVDELNDPAQTPPKSVAALKSIAATGDYARYPAEESRMLALAYVNASHFSAEAVRTYVRLHREALEQAGRGPQELWRALHTEALALHSLTDLFATGHILADRSRTMQQLARDEEERRLLLERAEHRSVKGALASFYHRLHATTEDEKARLLYGFYANVNHNGLNYHGATLTNLHGDTWRGYGDHRYRLIDGGEEKTTRQREVMKEAVKTSVLAIFEAAHGRPPPPGHDCAALQFIPVRYQNAVTNEDIWNEPAAVLKAAIKRNIHITSDGGLRSSLLKPKPLPDGEVSYRDYVVEQCGAACEAAASGR